MFLDDIFLKSDQWSAFEFFEEGLAELSSSVIKVIKNGIPPSLSIENVL